MISPEAREPSRDAGAAKPPAISIFADTPPSVNPAKRSAPAKLSVMAQRADFLRAAKARRQGTPGFLVQARARGDGVATLRVGYTCSKKIGNAVARNRAKRRLREVARAVLPTGGLPGWDYVLVGRPTATIDRAFSALLADLTTALLQIHGRRG